MLVYKGKVDGLKKREYQGRTRAHLQFVMTNEGGELTFLEIRIPDSMNPDTFRVGANIEVPVTYSVVQGEVYFKIDERVGPEAIKIAKG